MHLTSRIVDVGGSYKEVDIDAKRGLVSHVLGPASTKAYVKEYPQALAWKKRKEGGIS
jgi:hypothetical protein